MAANVGLMETRCDTEMTSKGFSQVIILMKLCNRVSEFQSTCCVSLYELGQGKQEKACSQKGFYEVVAL